MSEDLKDIMLAEALLETPAPAEIEVGSPSGVVGENKEASPFDALDINSVSLAAKQYRMFLPIFLNCINRMSRKEAIRTVENLMCYVLEDTAAKKPKTELEKKAIGIGQRLMDSRLVLQIYAAEEYAKSQTKPTEEVKNEEVP